jgi:hypothetical protein
MPWPSSWSASPGTLSQGRAAPADSHQPINSRESDLPWPAEARDAGQQLRETTLVIFGSPAAGTPVMAASPLAALDLPLKVLVWAGDEHVPRSCVAGQAPEIN